MTFVVLTLQTLKTATPETGHRLFVFVPLKSVSLDLRSQYKPALLGIKEVIRY